MKYRVLRTIIHNGEAKNAGDIVDIDSKIAEESPKSFEKVVDKKKKKEEN